MSSLTLRREACLGAGHELERGAVSIVYLVRWWHHPICQIGWRRRLGTGPPVAM